MITTSAAPGCRPPKRSVLAAALFACAAAWPGPAARAQTYTIVPNITTVPAGSYGINVHALLPGDTSSTPDVLLCVYTGYGSTAPIAASTFNPIAGGMEAKFDVLPSTIQEVPPSAFANGAFPASMYTVPLGTANCIGTAQAVLNTVVTLTLEYPQISSLSLASAPQQNAELTKRLPERTEVFGANFVQTSTSTLNSPSRVVFTATTAINGQVDFVSQSALQSTIPVTIPSTATSVAITVCNTTVYSYCSAPYGLPLTPLESSFGILSGGSSNNSSKSSGSIYASFGTLHPSLAGAPSGNVFFTLDGAPFVTERFTLDTVAVFVPAPSATLTTSSSVSSIRPVVADFNLDGIPDVLFAEPDAVTNGKRFPVLHLLLGTTPVAQFAPDLPYTGYSVHPCTRLIDIAVADFNADGYPDLAVLCGDPTHTESTAESVYVLLNTKDGHFIPTPTAFGPVYGGRIVAADFNHDGKPDLVFAGALDPSGDTGLQVLLGDNHGGLSAGPISTGFDAAPSASFGGFQIAAADLNNDGFPDIAILNGSSASGTVDKSIQLFQNGGTGAFTPAGTVPTDGTATANFFITTLGPRLRPDLIVTSSGSASPGISVAANTYATGVAFDSALKFTSVPGLTQAVVGDINGDGFLDIAVTDAKTTHVLTGDGAGNFTASNYSDLSFAPAAGSTLLAATDENGDGYADLITSVAGNGKTTLHSYIASGDAVVSSSGFTFSSGVHHLSIDVPGSVEIAPTSARSDFTVDGSVPTLDLDISSSSPLNFGNGVTIFASISGETATGPVSFYNGTTLFGTAPLLSGNGFVEARITPVLNAGTYNFSAVYPGDSNYPSLTSAPYLFVVDPVPPTITWTPRPATIAYGTPLSAAQLNAAAKGVAGSVPTGAFTYSPPLGTVLKLGTQPVSVSFASTNTNYTNASASTSITVTQAAPVITWPKPADVIVDTLLSSTQLNATAATPQGDPLPGTFSYTPAAGTKLSVAGTQQLSVLFTPTDTIDYTTATATVSINVGPIGISSIAPAAALLGDPNTTISIIGTGFSPTSKVQIVGPALAAVMLPTTYISSTNLSAVVPATDLLTVQVIQLSIVDPTKDLPSNSVPFTVSAPSTTVGVNAPTSISPASQNTVIFHLAPYPATVTANFTLTFTPSGTLPDDPGIIFVDSGLRTAAVTVPAHAAEFDLPITFQSGTISGTLTLTLLLEAGGANVTPATIKPIVIPEPFAAPGISSIALSPDGDLLTVTTRGFSNTRKITAAHFHFTPVSGSSLSTKDLTIDVNALFSTWYANPESNPYGSLFTYTEVFNLSSDALVVGQVTVTLTNDVGTSEEADTP